MSQEMPENRQTSWLPDNITPLLSAAPTPAREFNVYILITFCLHLTVLETNVLNALKEFCITWVATVNSFAKILNPRGVEAYILSHTHTHTHTHTHIYIYIYIYIQRERERERERERGSKLIQERNTDSFTSPTRTHTYTHAHIYIYIYRRLLKKIHIHRHAHTHNTHTHTHTYIYMYTYIYIIICKKEVDLWDIYECKLYYY